MKKIALIVGIFIVLGIAGAIYYFQGKTYELRFSESQIQEKLNQKLPLTKTYLIIFQVTLDKPRVNMENGSKRVNAGLDVILNIKVGKERKPLGGAVDVSGSVRYNPEQGKIYLGDPVIEKLSVQGIPEKYTDKVNTVLAKVLGDYFATHSIYTLKTTDLKQAAAKIILKDVTIENKELVVTLGY